MGKKVKRKKCDKNNIKHCYWGEKEEKSDRGMTKPCYGCVLSERRFHRKSMLGQKGKISGYLKVAF